MRKALLPMIASLALCGTATAALITTNAHADQSGRKPMMVAEAAPGELSGPRPMRGPGAPPEMMQAMAARHGQFCKDLYARRAGRLAFLEAKLSLNPTQAPLFERWKQVSMQIAQQHQNECETRRPSPLGRRPNIVDRLTMQETFLKKRLADIDAERPALAAFYDSLSPAQKEEFGHGGMHGMAMRMHGRHGMMMGGRGHPQNMGNPMNSRSPMGPPPPQ